MTYEDLHKPISVSISTHNKLSELKWKLETKYKENYNYDNVIRFLLLEFSDNV